MSYLGNTPTTQAFTPQVDYFSGDASTTAFTLSRPVASSAQVEAVIENVVQNPSSAYTVSGNTITFTSAPPSGTNNIYVRYTSPVTQVIAPSQGTVNVNSLTATGTPSSTTYLRGDNTWATVTIPAVTPAAVSDQPNTSTGYFDIPTGTTAERPASPATGYTRFNTTLNKFEVYQSGVFAQYDPSYSVEALVVAGGGGGGRGQNAGGGGGAGGYQSASATVIIGTQYAVTVGAGGAGSGSNASGANGANSSLGGSVTSIGGGGGGGDGANGISGGSGGGGGAAPNSVTYSGGSGTTGQGSNGGFGLHVPGAYEGGGGGGGPGGNGANANGNTGGAGGAGLNWQSLGTYYAGGGGGGGNGYGAGGTGGGGQGGAVGVSAIAGTANTGGGGGGAMLNGPVAAAGGSGIVIVRYAGAQRGTGGTVTSSGGYTYHTFTSSGTYTA